MARGVSSSHDGLAVARGAHLATDGPDRSIRAVGFVVPGTATRDLQIQPLPHLAQAPATPDTGPEFGDPDLGDPIALDDPMVWLQIVGFLLRLLMPLFSFLLIGGIGFWWVKRWLNRQRPKCDVCGLFMTLHHRKQAKPYLQAAQQVEVDLDSVFYSVAACPQCTRRKVFRFAAPNRLVTQCPRCHYKTMAITQQTTTLRPTAKREGEAMIHRTCRHCGYTATHTEVLSPNNEGKSEGLDAFLEDDWGLDRLRESYRHPSEVESSLLDSCDREGEDSLISIGLSLSLAP